jgi:hypothetical protein
LNHRDTEDTKKEGRKPGFFFVFALCPLCLCGSRNPAQSA